MSDAERRADMAEFGGVRHDPADMAAEDRGEPENPTGEKWHAVCRDCTSEAVYDNAEDAEAHALTHEATFGHETAVGRVC